MIKKTFTQEEKRELTKKIMPRSIIYSILGILFAIAISHLAKTDTSIWLIVGLSMLYVIIITVVSLSFEKKE
ncbi:MAG: hypothetical protein HG439_000700 [candidate division SR1 bacterium]|nr:hypothetical protein [candidate division SR1 bacterium]